jgi:hypothetical protein
MHDNMRPSDGTQRAPDINIRSASKADCKLAKKTPPLHQPRRGSNTAALTHTATGPSQTTASDPSGLAMHRQGRINADIHETHCTAGRTDCLPCASSHCNGTRSSPRSDQPRHAFTTRHRNVTCRTTRHQARRLPTPRDDGSAPHTASSACTPCCERRFMLTRSQRCTRTEPSRALCPATVLSRCDCGVLMGVGATPWRGMRVRRREE